MVDTGLLGRNEVDMKYRLKTVKNNGSHKYAIEWLWYGRVTSVSYFKSTSARRAWIKGTN